MRPSTWLGTVSLLNRDAFDSLVSATARSTAESSVHDDASGALLSHSAHDRSRRDAECHGPATRRVPRPRTVRPLSPVATPLAPRSPHRPAYQIGRASCRERV